MPCARIYECIGALLEGSAQNLLCQVMTSANLHGKFYKGALARLQE